MAVQLRSKNCIHAGCYDSPCCEIDESGFDDGSDGPDTRTDNYNVSAQTGSNLFVFVQFSIGFTDGFARLQLKADGVEIYNSGCTNTGDTDIVMVPSGTTTLSAVITQECSGTWEENSWEYFISCA
jgi:hypothetical protein